jgi:hypothetical protein
MSKEIVSLELGDFEPMAKLPSEAKKNIRERS